MTNNPPEQTRPGEFMTQNQPIALQMRLLIGSPEALNPTRTDLPQVDENALENLHATTRDDVLKKISISSTAESLNYWGQRIVTAAQQHVDLSNHQTQLATWKTEMLQIMRNQTNQRHLNTLQQVHIGTGADQINFGALNDQEMQKLYDRYFKNTPQEINTVTFQVQGVEIKKVPAHIKKFADDMRAAHTDAAGTVDYTALQSHLESIGWLAKIFGPGSSEIIKELLQGEIKLQTDRTQFVGHANEDVNGTKRINFLNPRERHLLQVLQLSENGRLDTQAAPPGGDPPDPTPDVEIDPNRRYQLDEIFQEIPGTFNPAHRFVVENPQDTLDFTDPELAQLGDDKKFFLDIVTQPNGLTTWKTNENVVPFTWELGTTSASPDQRFINGEKYTHNDSGLLALSAASTSTPENQAKLYRSYVDAILRAHKNSLDTNTDLSQTFLGKWLTSQGALDPAHLDSIAIFFSNDRDASQNPSVLRPENERLLDYDPHGNLKSNPEIVELWKNRIDELQTALQNNQLQSHHIRWIEFLSHSIDIQKLVDKAKSQPVPPTPSNTPPPGGRPGTPSAPPASRAPVTRSPTLRSAAPPDPNLQHNPNQQPTENRSIEDAYRTYIGLVTLELPRAQQALADFEQTHQGLTAWAPYNISAHDRLVQDVEKIEQYIRTANKEATDVEELVLKEMFSFTDTQTRTITGDALISPIYHELVESLMGYEFEALQGSPDLKLDKDALRTSLIKFNQKLIAQGLIQNPLFNNDVEQFISEHNSYRQKAYVVPKTI